MSDPGRTSASAAEADVQSLTEVRTALPRIQATMVRRSGLIADITDAEAADVVTVVAPAGYGKTTLLAQWAREAPQPVAWLTLGPEHNAPERLVADIGQALGKAGLTTKSLPTRRVTREAAASLGVAAISRALSRPDGPGILVLDQAEHLGRRSARDVVEGLAQHLGGGRLVVASRSELPVSRTRLRAQGRLLELDERDLAMEDDEARLLLDSHRVTDQARAAEILGLCEGWPVAIHLMALAADSPQWRERPQAPGGGVRFLLDYISEELIDRLPPRPRSFLTRTSLLDQLNGPLCDAALGVQNSTQYLRKLEETTHLVHIVDPAGTWYEVIRPVRDALREELGRVAPDEIPSIHRGAAAWFEENRHIRQAIEHSRLGGDLQRSVRNLLGFARTGYSDGEAPLVLDWLRWFERSADLSDHPDVAAVGALVFSLEGQGLDAERWLDNAFGESGVPAHPVAFSARALTTRTGIADMLADITTGQTAMGNGSEWLPGALLIEALAHAWSGDPGRADPLLAEAITLGGPAGAAVTRVLGLGQRGLIAMNLGDWGIAAQHSSDAAAEIEARRLAGYSVSGLPLVVAARVARHRGELSAAEALLSKAALARPKLNSAIPGLAVQTELEMAKAYAELSDVVGARALLRDAGDVLLQRPDLGTLPQQVEDLKSALQGLGPGTVGPSALTKAELRLLPLLATHLTFPEIGDRLFISRHTVKTQAMSIYRKLGSSSRSEAVAKAIASGLLTT